MPTAHIESKLEDIAENVLMPGDPLRAKYIADNFLTDVKLVNSVRNMLAYTGLYKGHRVTIFSSGMGIPSIGIYSYELFKFYNVKNIIRIGTCGSFNKDIKLLDVVLSSGAEAKTYFAELLDGGKTNYAEASTSLNTKIIETANALNKELKVGKTITSDVFDPYCDDASAFRSNFKGDDYKAVEMESFALFYLANKFKRNATALFTVVDSKYDNKHLSSKMRETSLNDMISLALESIIK